MILVGDVAETTLVPAGLVPVSAGALLVGLVSPVTPGDGLIVRRPSIATGKLLVFALNVGKAGTMTP